MKKAMELPANFLVLLILGLIMFAAAMTIAYKVFKGAENLQKSLDQQTRKQIENRLILDPSGKVLLGIASKEIQRGKNDVFGIGIRNLESEEKTFYVSGSCNLAIAEDGKAICDENRVGGDCANVCGKWILTIGSHKLNSKDIRVTEVHINVPKNAADGEYWFDVKVCYNNPCGVAGSIQYDNVKKLTVTVS